MDEIKTEVDRLIDLLKTGAGKPMRLSELASLTGLTVPQTRKWIHILEERRQVRVRYNLAEEQVEWMASVPSSSGHVRSPPPSTFSAEPPAEPGDNAADLNVEMARYNERRYRTAHRVPQDEAAQMEVPKPPVSEHEASGVRLPPERTFPTPTSRTPSLFEQNISSYSKNEEARAGPITHPDDEAPEEPASVQVFEFALPPLPKMDQKSMQMSAALKAKMNQARAKREQIEKLKTEKKRLLIEVYRPLETRLEQETGVITEKLVELENRLLSLREEAAKVPNEVADLAGEQERIVQVAGEMHRLYAQTDSQMTRSLNTLNQAHADAQRRLAQAREILEAQRKQGEELEQQSSQLQSLQEQTQERIRLAQEALATQAARIETGLEGLRQMESLRGQLDEQIQAGKGDMESQKSLLSEIEHQLGRIDEVQHWVQEHQVEYNSRMTRLTQYASNASAEYKKLKAAIDSGYVHRYLRDLRALSDSYEFELSQAQQTETDIDARLDETKKALSMLIAQARELADTQEMHLTQPAGTDEQMEGHSQEMDKASSDLLDATSDIVSHGVSRQKLREHVRRVRTDEEEAEPLPDSAPVSVVIEPPAGVMMRKGKDLSRKKVKTRPKE